MKKYSIYRFTNKINGKIYIGKTCQHPSTRKSQHINASKSGSNFILHSAIRKYGIEVFEFDVIYNALDENSMSKAEVEFILQYNCCILDDPKCGYNMTRGGEGFSSETGKKYAGWNNPDYINPWSGEKGSALSSKLNKDRVIAGTNPWAGENGSKNSRNICERQLKEGRHPFQGVQGSKLAKRNIANQIANGTHINQREYVCPHCGKTGKGAAMLKWHFKNCRLK